MDLLQQRLTFASMWAFEAIGIQELETELRLEIPLANIHCEYSPGDEILIVKGKLEGQMAAIAKLVSTFIERQKSKDLLDTPRIRLLALPSAVRENTTDMEFSDTRQQEGLLVLDDDSTEFIPHQMTQVTKFWISSAGGIGCFGANDYMKMLQIVAKGTGTEVTIPTDLKAIRVSGRCADDVDEALSKLSEVEKPLSYIRCPVISNVDIRPIETDARYMVQPVAKLNSTAIRRILADPADPTLSANFQLGQMFVTALYSFDEDVQSYTAPKNLLHPPRYSNEITKSRLWSDFTFQEVGNGDEFGPLESVMDGNHAESRVAPSGILGDHPFLSPEKAKQVNQWVADETNMGDPDATPEAKPEALQGQASRVGSPKKKSASSKVKTNPGIKKRRPIQPTQTSTAQDTKAPSPTPRPSAPQVVSDDIASNPRKKWKMNYEPTNDSPPQAQESKPQSNFGGIIGNRNQSTIPSNESHAPHLRNKSPPRPFDAGDYGLKKKSTELRKCNRGPRNAERIDRVLEKSKSPIQKDMLIDVTSGDTIISNSQLSLDFDVSAKVPALTPNVSGSNNWAGKSGKDDSRCSNLYIGTHAADLHGLELHDNAKQSGSASTVSLHGTSSNKENPPSQAARLQFLSAEYSKYSVTVSTNSVGPHTRPGHANRLLENQVIEQYERSYRPETEQCISEAQSRLFHHTMNQKTSRPRPKAMSKAAKQATLMDAWGMPERKKAVDGNLQGRISPSTEKSSQPHVIVREQEKQRVQKQQKEARFREDIRRFFAAMKPALEAAESFPGNLTFEIQIGLVFIPSLPKTCNTDNLISPGEWSSILQPQNGVMAPTTKFFNRVTVSGSDVDHIIDLKRSRAEGKFRIFEQEYSGYNISYEFHCRTKTGDLLVVVLDEQGKYLIQNSASVLGAVNLHFPKHIWDARAVLESTTRYHPDMNPEFEDAVKYLAEHVWIPAEKNIHIFTSLPHENRPSIEKVFMKRWTRHRYTRPDEAPRGSVKGSDCGSQVGCKERNDSQDIFLQVTEIQDLFVGFDDKDNPRLVRARYTNTAEMTQRGKMWYEVSLVSPALEAILKANECLEIGERTEDWRAAELFGECAALLTEESPNPAADNTVAAAIGGGGIANLFELANIIVPKIDGVGHFNSGPIIAETLQVTVGGPDAPKGKTFEELDSVKEVESVVARIDPSVHDSEVAKREKFEREYW
ncbi:hypothetical protein BJY01DRAFT_80562 [Aspergillus pseudoustus]|uniref:K Homology domain-containing protein n=1 Tax=Aspergillus pseudoustus TaxID=1810923 RepID=A0ABR4J5A2_9EURO